MKIFWSWQSDTLGKIGRHFIREVLEDALKQLNVEDELDEPLRENLHLDHDRKGVPGSPDLAQAILEKIRNSAVFIADVTPIGKTDKGKSLINPNVAIELGYALYFVGDEGLLMVLNEAYGDRESLPFDLRHKGGPIIFNLPADSNKEQITRVRAQLVGDFKSALRDCLNSKRSSIESTLQNPHVEIPSISSCAQYFKPKEVLVKHRTMNVEDDTLFYEPGALIYLRIIPTEAMGSLKEPEISDLICKLKVSPLRFRQEDSIFHGRNKYGGMIYSFKVDDGKERLLNSTQIFPNRELWGIDSKLLSGKSDIPSTAYERVLSKGLHDYINFAENHLGYKCPFIVEAGASGVEDYYMAMDQAHSYEHWGPITSSEISSRWKLVDLKPESVNSILLKIFEYFFEATGTHRPPSYNGFPANIT
jgi:hypothetical protein